MWTVQQFEHDLASLSIEGYLDFALQEKPNHHELDEIRKYNETVRVMQQFPRILEPRILLLPHPRKGSLMRDLTHYDFGHLDYEYRIQVAGIRQLIFKRALPPKKFNHVAVSGMCMILFNLV